MMVPPGTRLFVSTTRLIQLESRRGDATLPTLINGVSVSGEESRTGHSKSRQPGQASVGIEVSAGRRPARRAGVHELARRAAGVAPHGGSVRSVAPHGRP